LQLSDSTLARNLRNSAFRLIGEVQAADNPGRFEPGTGEINYPVVARKLDAMGYNDPVAMEGFAESDSDRALAAFRAAFTI